MKTVGAVLLVLVTLLAGCARPFIGLTISNSPESIESCAGASCRK